MHVCVTFIDQKGRVRVLILTFCIRQANVFCKNSKTYVFWNIFWMEMYGKGEGRDLW